MKWVRSYYRSFEDTMKLADKTQRGFVYDPTQCEPVFIEGFNYWDMFNAAEDDIILIEWDMAISREDRRLFEKYCQEKNDIVHVAPYKHYSYHNAYERTGWVHRSSAMCFAREGDPFAFFVGFGLVYLPLKMMKEYVQAVNDKMIVRTDRDEKIQLGTIIEGIDEDVDLENFVSDCTFSYWHNTVYGNPIPIHWDVRPVHLHYFAPVNIPSKALAC